MPGWSMGGIELVTSQVENWQCLQYKTNLRERNKIKQKNRIGKIPPVKSVQRKGHLLWDPEFWRLSRKKSGKFKDWDIWPQLGALASENHCPPGFGIASPTDSALRRIPRWRSLALCRGWGAQSFDILAVWDKQKERKVWG